MEDLRKQDTFDAERPKHPLFAIVCDSSCDLSPQTCRRLGITLVSERLTSSDGELLDRNMTEDETAQRASTLSRMRVIAPDRGSFVAALEDLVDEGYTEIVIALPSARILSSYTAAQQAANDVKGARIQVLDTPCFSGQLALVLARLVLDRNAGVSVDQAVEHAMQLATTSQLYCMLSPRVDLAKAPILDDRRRLRRSIMSLSMRVSGGWIQTNISDTGVMTVERRSESLAWLAGIVARSLSRFAQRVGPLTLLELYAGDPLALATMRKPLDTNEFESHTAATIALRPSSVVQMGFGAVGVAAVPQELLDPDQLAALLDDENGAW